MNYAVALVTLQTFRLRLYRCFGRRADALMELTDALLTAGPVLSPAHLSQEPVHRRGWGSLYAALARGRINLAALRLLVAQYPLANGQAIYAVDTTTWPRCDAETSPERGFYYHPSRHSAGQPIVAGWSYSWISQLSFERDSWTAPLDVERVCPDDTAEGMAAEQIEDLLRCLPADPAAPVPLFVFDAGYDPVQLAQELDATDTVVQVLVRLRKDRCFYADPDPARAAATGRPRRHGRKFVFRDSATWWTPTDEYTTDDPQYGTVRVRAWAGLHAKVQNHATKGTLLPRPVLPGTIVLVEVSRLPGHSRPPKRLWLWWRGPGTPDLAVLWRAYIRRFDEEHTFRFLKQILNWTAPRVRHPEQADRWTGLVLAAYTQLRLARTCVHDRRLPWERRLTTRTLTPYRVRRAFSALLSVLGTPAKPPKPCGRSPGRPKGRLSGPAPRHPALKKSA
ncbi:NF041680 family putative transposase [Arthrobacter sp.]|uniref:NF041680 family putative transposase n=1 Tax=Arthrobacter sp. TaxID=1667 RepID=UPI00258EBFBB|nr:NF041680 family putative transposase [Arthrobacter sp.]